MATPFQLQLQFGMGLAGTDSGIGFVFHAHGLQEFLGLQPAHVCDVPSRDGRRPFLRVCDACPPRVAYRIILCQQHDERKLDDDGPLSLTFVFAVTI